MTGNLYISHVSNEHVFAVDFFDGENHRVYFDSDAFVTYTLFEDTKFHYLGKKNTLNGKLRSLFCDRLFLYDPSGIELALIALSAGAERPVPSLMQARKAILKRFKEERIGYGVSSCLKREALWKDPGLYAAADTDTLLGIEESQNEASRLFSDLERNRVPVNTALFTPDPASLAYVSAIAGYEVPADTADSADEAIALCLKRAEAVYHYANSVFCTTQVKIRESLNEANHWNLPLDAPQRKYGIKALEDARLKDLPCIRLEYPGYGNVLQTAMDLLRREYGENSDPYRIFMETVYPYFKAKDGTQAEDRSSKDSICRFTFFDENGEKSDCSADFSYGGLHGCRTENGRSVTFAGDVIHADFRSYYPNLLLNMKAFGTNDSRYREIFERKQSSSGMEKEGYKLILNAVTGAIDFKYDRHFYMPNTALSMRLIGQLLIWCIGQDLSFHGATLVSVNTDGLYVTDISFEDAESVISPWERAIRIEIEPEEIRLISKDSNSRIEITDTVQASGDLGNRDGVRAGRKPLRPTIVDLALSDAYVRYFNMISKGYAVRVDESDLDSYLNEDPESLKRFQQVEKGPEGKCVFFASDEALRDVGSVLRIFYVKAGCPLENVYPKGAIRMALYETYDADAQASLLDAGKEFPTDDPLAKDLLAKTGYIPEREDERKGIDAAVIRNCSFDRPEAEAICVICEDLYTLDEPTRSTLSAWIDRKVYVGMIEEMNRKWFS